jgi:hypothetical protein
MFDFMQILPILIVLVILGFVAKMVMPMIMWLLNRSTHWVERPVDVTGAVLKKIIKGSKMNKAGVSQAKNLICLGERDYYQFRWGSIKGISSGKFCEEIAVKTGRLTPCKLVMAPKELLRDKHGRNLIIQCNGFEAFGHLWVPVFCSGTPDEVVKGYMDLIRAQWNYRVQNEKFVESIESGAHAMTEALDIDRRNWDVINREDHVKKVPGMEGGEAYADEAA